MYIDHVGLMTIKNFKTGHYAEIDFKKRGWSSKDYNKIEGKVFD